MASIRMFRVLKNVPVDAQAYPIGTYLFNSENQTVYYLQDIKTSRISVFGKADYIFVELTPSEIEKYLEKSGMDRSLLVSNYHNAIRNSLGYLDDIIDESLKLHELYYQNREPMTCEPCCKCPCDTEVKPLSNYCLMEKTLELDGQIPTLAEVQREVRDVYAILSRQFCVKENTELDAFYYGLYVMFQKTIELVDLKAMNRQQLVSLYREKIDKLFPEPIIEPIDPENP